MTRRARYSVCAGSTFACAVLFFPWFLPRETVSGLMGRWEAEGLPWQVAFARPVGQFLDAMVHRPASQEDCYTTFIRERQARRILYTNGEVDEC